ncbi:glutathione-disulfide reductase [Candidatus Liberibacter sp.]|uniref:glutathione-disulfide reductase n=1 Tax=Candidatus Liberibacter sp. TaxID=34022 RepID=UPI0015F4B9E5|nr:glutathione-disulfide reductase [Candidatus Liberibacter sp.]MBA5724449.1 glutathione-disulfide reductase [Candidatus Liberibacter sp.]
MMSYDYDLLVIGAGSAGVRAARLAAQIGKKVAICEEYRFGGTCVIRGCVPKKLMFYASQYSDHFEDAKGFGWNVDRGNFDWKSLICAKDKEISRLEEIYRNILISSGAEILESRAVLSSPHSVYLEKLGRAVTAEYILVATGSTPNRMEILEGSEFCITSEEIFYLEELPQSILIVGGGYIAVEFAGIFNSLGVKTSLVVRKDEILSGFDSDMRQGLTEIMLSRGIQIFNNDTICGVFREGKKFRSVLQSGAIMHSDQVMLALGRKPHTTGIGLEALGVAMNAAKAIITDKYSRSNIQSIFAFGDVTGRIQLTPVAIHAAACFIETQFKGNRVSPDYDLVPTAVFSQPEIGTVGLTEEEASQRFNRLEVYKTKFYPMKASLSKRFENQIMKIIVNADDRKVLGVHILGDDAAELIQAIGISVKLGCSKEDFDRCMAVHPTAAEELVTMYSPCYYIRDGKKISH